MRVFKFSMTKRLDSINTELFRGTFTVNDSQVLRGIIKHSDGSINYIYGTSDELDNRLAFMELSNDHKFVPLLFLFSNYDSGIFSKFDYKCHSFLAHCRIDGIVSIEIEEINSPSASLLAERVLRDFSELISEASMTNQHLMSRGVSDYFL